MAIPDFQTIMLPLLKYMGDDKEHSIHDMVDALKAEFNLSVSEIEELIPSGKQPMFYNKVGWARTYLAKAGLLELTKRTYYKITPRGHAVLDENLDRLNIRYLTRFPEFLEFRERKPKPSHREVESANVQTPEEILEDAIQDIREKVMQELLAIVKTCTPAFFEKLVVELLVKMGYGGSWKEAARAVGHAGDGGIDGIIDEDRLGLDTIYIQAKRWDGTVGRPEIQKFVGTLMGKKAKKGGLHHHIFFHCGFYFLCIHY